MRFLSAIAASMVLIAPAMAIAHQVETNRQVGATLHIEPNDTPKAGTPSLAWFALTRRGGKIIPLAECDCRLAVYSIPVYPGKEPLARPELKAISAERYRGIPGAEIAFPEPGAYQLFLTGKPQNGAQFEPFQLVFEVTVARR